MAYRGIAAAEQRRRQLCRHCWRVARSIVFSQDLSLDRSRPWRIRSADAPRGTDYGAAAREPGHTWNVSREWSAVYQISADVGDGRLRVDEPRRRLGSRRRLSRGIRLAV